MKIVAIVHEDIKGPQRLEKLLNRVRPRAIAFQAPLVLTSQEIQAHTAKLCSTKLDAVNERSTQNNITEYMRRMFSSYYYEYRVLLEFAHFHDCSLHPIDISETLDQWGSISDPEPFVDRMYDTLINNTYIRKQFVDDIIQFHNLTVDQRYDDPAKFARLQGSAFPRRDLNMGEGIRESWLSDMRMEFTAKMLLELNPDVFVGGIEDIEEFRRQASMYLKLRDKCRADIVKLRDVDSWE